MTKDELTAKFMANVKFSGKVTAENAEKLLQLLDELERLSSIADVVRLLIP